MKASIRLGRALGVDIGLHYSWFFLAALFVMGLSGRFRQAAPDAAPALIWLSAAATAAAFFAGLLLHELSHVAAARSRGLAVRGITLFALGGVAETGEDARDPGSELLIGIVGPITSAALAALCLAAAALAASLGAVMLEASLRWLGAINLVLAAFNLLPAYPMDGGRVLRAAIWKATGSRDRATRLSAAAGQVFGGLLILIGAVGVLRGAGFGGLWLALIGFFLFQAAAVSAWSAGASETLRSLRVGDVMSPEIPEAAPEEPLRDVVEDQMRRRGRRCVFVRRGGRMLGLVTTSDVGRVNKDRWAGTPVASAMVPAERLRTVPPRASIQEALEAMGRERVEQLPVVEDGELLGVVTKADIVRALQTRRELPD